MGSSTTKQNEGLSLLHTMLQNSQLLRRIVVGGVFILSLLNFINREFHLSIKYIIYFMNVISPVNNYTPPHKVFPMVNVNWKRTTQFRNRNQKEHYE